MPRPVPCSPANGGPRRGLGDGGLGGDGYERAQGRDHLPDLFPAARWRVLGERLCLTPRQLEVARLICHSRTNPEIAKDLGVSESTARLHADRLFKALGVGSRVGVVVRLVLADRRLPRARK